MFDQWESGIFTLDITFYNNNNNLIINLIIFFYLQVAKSPSRLRLKAKFSKERSQLYRAQSRPDESN